MLRTEKAEVVENLKEMFTANSAVVLSNYQGLNMAQFSALRKKMHEQGAQLVVTKNTLSRIAAKDSTFSSLEQYLSGPTAISVSNDPIGMAKVLTSFAEENEQLKLIVAVIDGKPLDVNGIKALSKMPPLNDLRAKIIGLLKSPASAIASILVAPLRKTVGVVSAYAEKKV